MRQAGVYVLFTTESNENRTLYNIMGYLETKTEYI